MTSAKNSEQIRLERGTPSPAPDVLKKYCALIHGQPVLEAVLELKRRNDLSAAHVEHVRCDIFQTGFDIAGGGGFGAKDHPQTKEQADYNLKYLIAAALLDDQVGPAQLEPARVRAPDAQALLARVDIRPLSWDRTVEKFHWLSEAFADAELRHALVRAVQRLDARPLSELTDLLLQVRPSAGFPTTHPGIQ
jgi:2-methylcitrate dehydratase